ncbi:MAG TPA: 3-dehydroquinate synthase family protein [Actinomycetota bacterium]|nr:3-dehydroquinate synthase family protein [Actinomycetota bacterium]
MKAHRVELGADSYQVVVGTDILDAIPEILPSGPINRIAIVEDAGVPEPARDALENVMGEIAEVRRIAVPGGEQVKSLASVEKVLEMLAQWPLRRSDLVVGFGGGATTDLAGFVASVYQRGVKVCHVPTTLLGQVDAAIGGKTAVNLAGKNMTGTFHQPCLVICDVATTRSLSEDHLRSGLAEVIKYGLCFDSALLSLLRDDALNAFQKDPEAMVSACVRIKAEIVAIDTFDKSVRRHLNYGHTLGHALELATGFEELMHGEAISIGMTFAAEMSLGMGLLSDEEVNLHRQIISGAGLPVSTNVTPETVIPLLTRDKKFRDDQAWVLLEGLQRPFVKIGVPQDAVLAAYAKVSHDG